MKGKWFGVAAGVGLLVALIIGVVQSLQPPRPSAGPATPGVVITQTQPQSSTSTNLEEQDGHDPDPEPTPTPPSAPTGPAQSPGSDHEEHDEVPEAAKKALLARNTEFWNAFSIRDAKARDTALAKVAVPYLAEKMSVPRTDRIPVVKVKRAVVVEGSYTLAHIVTEAADGTWYLSTFIFDPVTETWGAQAYDLAPMPMIAKAKKLLG